MRGFFQWAAVAGCLILCSGTLWGVLSVGAGILAVWANILAIMALLALVASAGAAVAWLSMRLYHRRPGDDSCR